MESVIDVRLQEIDRQISEHERAIAACAAERSELRNRLRRLHVKKGYLRFAIWLRTVGKDFELWQIGVMIVLPLAISAVAFSSLYVVTNLFLLSFALTLIVLLASAAFTAVALFRDEAQALSARYANVLHEMKQSRSRLEEVKANELEARRELAAAISRKSEQIAGEKFTREQLLKKNWRAMCGDEWLSYLSSVLQALGATVEPTETTGVDVIATFRGRRIAIQAKGYHNIVNHVAVQRAVAGMAEYQCHGCAVISNSRFTALARELAKTNGCTLIGEHNFEQFVRGERPL